MFGTNAEAKGRRGMEAELTGWERKTPEKRKDNQYEGAARKRKATKPDSNPQKNITSKKERN